MNDLNNSNDLGINRGFELILRRKKPDKKTFSLSFDKMVGLFKRELSISFSFSFDLRKQK
jgi:plasmid replication initiation protein